MTTIPNNAPPWLFDYDRDSERRIDDKLTMPEVLAAALPDPARFERRWIFVRDESGGAVPAFSDGTNWRRATDRAVVS